MARPKEILGLKYSNKLNLSANAEFVFGKTKAGIAFGHKEKSMKDDLKKKKKNGM